MSDTAKQQWTPPTVTEFDIAERTQLEGGPSDDAFDPAAGGGGDAPDLPDTGEGPVPGS